MPSAALLARIANLLSVDLNHRVYTRPSPAGLRASRQRPSGAHPPRPCADER